jgi:hypothetical protein
MNRKLSFVKNELYYGPYDDSEAGEGATLAQRGEHFAGEVAPCRLTEVEEVWPEILLVQANTISRIWQSAFSFAAVGLSW